MEVRITKYAAWKSTWIRFQVCGNKNRRNPSNDGIKIGSKNGVTQAVATIFPSCSHCIVCVSTWYEILVEEKNSLTAQAQVLHQYELHIRLNEQVNTMFNMIYVLPLLLPRFQFFLTLIHRQINSIENIFAYHSLMLFPSLSFTTFSMRFLNLFCKTLFDARKSIVGKTGFCFSPAAECDWKLC